MFYEMHLCKVKLRLIYFNLTENKKVYYSQVRSNIVVQADTL